MTEDVFARSRPHVNERMEAESAQKPNPTVQRLTTDDGETETETAGLGLSAAKTKVQKLTNLTTPSSCFERVIPQDLFKDRL